MAKLPTEPAIAAPAVTTADTDALVVVVELLLDAALVVGEELVLAVAELLAALVVVVTADEAMEEPALLEAEVEAVEEPETVPPAKTSEQNCSVAGRTWPVATVAPQALMTHDVAAPTKAFSLLQMHL